MKLTSISLLDVYLSKEIQQNLLLTERAFERYARERGLNIGLEELENYEELGLLFPLCRLHLPVVEEYRSEGKVRKRYAPLFNISHTLSKWYESGYCEDPVKTKFRSWKEYKDGYQETARVLYHPWQFITLKTVVHWLGHQLSVTQILDELASWQS